MRRLFLKMFLWFWITSALTGVFLVLAIILQHRSIHDQAHHGLADTVRYFGTAAAGVYDQSGSEATSRYIRELSQDAQIQGCLYDEIGHSLAGQRCDEFQSLAMHIVHGEPSEFSIKGNLAQEAVPIRRSGKRTYIFVSELLVGEHAFLKLQPEVVIVRGAAALLVSGFICFFLARYLTNPILRLRSVAQRFTAGKLDERAETALVARRDELGDFAKDFNRMADTSEQLISSQRQLLHDVSHELRSPLARMNVAVDLLRGRVEHDPALDHIEVDLQRLNEMIGKLLAVTKLEASPTLQSSEPVELSELLSRVAIDAEFETQESGSRIEVVSTCEASVLGDRNLLRSAIENVVRNATNFAPVETPVELNLDTLRRGTSWFAKISVRDYGIGVMDEELAHIFKPFYRVPDSGSRDSSGVGLGLSITERIVRLHGGSIEASNAVGGGLRVDILFPLLDIQNQA